MNIEKLKALAKRYSRNTRFVPSAAPAGADGALCALWLHQTPIVTVYRDNVVLSTGGWWTLTTKRRINEALEALEILARVEQRDFNWYVTLNGETYVWPNPVQRFTITLDK